MASRPVTSASPPAQTQQPRLPVRPQLLLSSIWPPQALSEAEPSCIGTVLYRMSRQRRRAQGFPFVRWAEDSSAPLRSRPLANRCARLQNRCARLSLPTMTTAAHCTSRTSEPRCTSDAPGVGERGCACVRQIVCGWCVLVCVHVSVSVHVCMCMSVSVHTV